MEFLLRNGADINIGGNHDWTALHTAAVNGHIQMVQYLISKGAKINVKTDDGSTALHVVLEYSETCPCPGHKSIIELLLARNDTEINVKDDFGRTALHTASFFGKLKALNILVKHEK